MSVDERSNAQNFILRLMPTYFPDDDITVPSISTLNQTKKTSKPTPATGLSAATSSSINSDNHNNNINNNTEHNNNNNAPSNSGKSKTVKTRNKGTSARSMADFIKACEVDLVINNSDEDENQEPTTKKSLQEEFDFYMGLVLKSLLFFKLIAN
jgi:hypothetical protein